MIMFFVSTSLRPPGLYLTAVLPTSGDCYFPYHLSLRQINSVIHADGAHVSGRLSPDQSVNYTCGADAPLAVDVILDILDGRAGPHRFFAGGTEIIDAAFKADTLLGPNFEGKPHSAYLTQLINFNLPLESYDVTFRVSAADRTLHQTVFKIPKGFSSLHVVT
jgi:hypothetical protein